MYQFQNKTYSNGKPTGINRGEAAIDLNDLSGPELVALHNLVQSNLGKGTTKRFKDTATGVKRTEKALAEYAAVVAAEEAAGDGSTPAPAAPAATLSKADKQQIAAEAKDRLKTEAKAPRVLKRRDARRLKDGSYKFDILPRKPRTEKISEAREELLGYLASGEATWEGLLKFTGKPPFNTVTTVTTFAITLGYGVQTQDDGTIKLLEPLK